jgi:hypothetical protein
MVLHLVFNVTELFLDELLIAQHIVKLGWDGIDEIKDSSRCRTYRQNSNTSNCLLLDSTPPPPPTVLTAALKAVTFQTVVS